MTNITYPLWIDVAENLYKNNNTYTKIAEVVGASRKTVSHYLRKKGHVSNPKYARVILPEKLRKGNYDFEDIFEIIDSEEKAYWLGFLMADGTISDITNAITLGLKEDDYGHIVKFKNFLGTDRKITKTTKTIGEKTHIGYKISVNSLKMKNDLIALGCVPRKTFDIAFPTKNQIPDHLIRHFVRGYFDGDGCITTGNTSKIVIELLGTEVFLVGFMNWSGLHHNSINTFKHSDIKRVAYAGHYAINVLNKMYEDSIIYLERKHNRYLKYCRPESSVA